MSHLFEPITPAVINWDDNHPRSLEYDDIYYSNVNGLNESRYVFIEANRLIGRWKKVSSVQPFLIAELGFGSGLNFLLTWQLWSQSAPDTTTLHFISCEKNPLSIKDLKNTLSQWPQLAEFSAELIEKYPTLTPGYHHLTFEQGRVRLTLMLGDAKACYEALLCSKNAELQNKLRFKSVDAWYLDGFSPIKNPSMWSQELFNTMGLLSDNDTTLSTFSSAGAVRRGLEEAGFTVEKIKGYRNKREMLVGNFHGGAKSLPNPSSSWAFPVYSQVQNKNKETIVIGAGLAGCMISYQLAQRGWQVTLLDKHANVANEASANPNAVLFPNISAYKSPLTDFMLSAFLYATRFYSNLLGENIQGEQKGLLQLLPESDAKKRLALEQWLAHYPDLATVLSAEKASELAGVFVNKPALYIPKAGWFNCKNLCLHLVKHPNIRFFGNQSIHKLNRLDNRWVVNEFQARNLVIANGFCSNQYEQTLFVPLKSIRGQLTFIKQNRASQSLKVPICGEGHVLPAIEGIHALGASYDLDNSQSLCKQEDNLDNLKKLNKLPIDACWSNDVVSEWAGVRAVTTDYLPVVGAVPVKNQFSMVFQKLAYNAKLFINQPMPCHDGLYVISGFGSRGLTSAPLCAEWLAGLMNREASCLPQQMIESIAPARFLKKSIIKTPSENN